MLINKHYSHTILHVLTVKRTEGIFELVTAPYLQLMDTMVAKRPVLVHDVPEHQEARLDRHQEGGPLDDLPELVEVAGVPVAAELLVG